MVGKTIKGITIELDGSTVKLGKALKNILGESKSLEKQLKQVDNALRLDPTNTELLATKQRLLGDQIENTAKHLELLRKAEEKAAASVGNYDDWAAAYAPIQAQIDKTRKKLTELSAEQKKMERVGDIDTDAYRKLSAEIEDLQESLKDLHKQGEAVNEQFGEPISTREYEQLQTEIVLTEAKLNEARKEADRVADTLKKIDSGELKDVSKAAKNAEDALEGAKKEAADFGDVLKANVIADGAKAIAESMADVVEETKEYQKIMGSLEVSSELAGYTTDQTREAYEKLYGVLADDQSSATTLANLQALHLEQADLLAVIDSAIGGWAKYGDSIPIDSLAESINETIKAGQVTGTFADILNWGAREGETYGVKLRAATEANEDWNNAVTNATTAEDYFNLALQECSNETERSNLVLQAMADQGLSTIAQKWRENNEALVENNEANAQLQEQMGTLGETLMPITTILTEMLTKALAWFNGLDAGTQKFIVSAVLLAAVLLPIVSIGSNLLQGISSFITISGGMPSLISTISGAFSGLSSLLSGAVTGAIGGIGTALSWLAANPFVLVIERIREDITVELTAVDLHLLNRSIESFRYDTYIRAVSVPHKFAQTLLCHKQTFDLLKPQNDTITLGSSYSTFTGTVAKTSVMASQVTEVRKDVNTLNLKTNRYKITEQRLTSLLAQSFGVFKTEEVLEDGSTVHYMHDKPTLAESTNIWKMTGDAFAVSSDGGATWNAGLDASGNAIFNILSVIGIEASWINADNLTAISANLGGWLVDNEKIYKEVTDVNDATVLYRVYIKPPTNEKAGTTEVISCQKSKDAGASFNTIFSLLSNGSIELYEETRAYSTQIDGSGFNIMDGSDGEHHWYVGNLNYSGYYENGTKTGAYARLDLSRCDNYANQLAHCKLEPEALAFWDEKLNTLAYLNDTKNTSNGWQLGCDSVYAYKWVQGAQVRSGDGYWGTITLGGIAFVFNGGVLVNAYYA